MLYKSIAFFAVVFAVLLAEAKQFGLTYGYTDYLNRPFFAVGDFNHFNANKGSRAGNYRYGFGAGQLELGLENAALQGKSHNGMTVIGLMGSSGLGPHVGVGLFNMEGRVNSNQSYNNFYLWQPSVDVGAQLAASQYVVLTADIKVGGSATNYYSVSGLEPKYDLLHGYCISARFLNVSVAIDNSRFGTEERESASLSWNNLLSISTERNSLNRGYSIGIRQEM